MRLLDSHVHFWEPRHLTYPWLAEVPALNRAFTPEDLAADRPEPADVVFVEAGRAAHQAVAEIDRIRRAARHRPWIRGVVAHADLEDPARARQAIRAYTGDPFVVGVRRNVQDEAAGFTTGDAFRAGVRLLGETGLPFDACVRAHQLPELAELAAACPGPPSSSTTSASRRSQATRRGDRHCAGWHGTATSSASSPAWPPRPFPAPRARTSSRRCARPCRSSVPAAACTAATGR